MLSEPWRAQVLGHPESTFANGCFQFPDCRVTSSREVLNARLQRQLSARTANHQCRFTHKADLAWCSAAVRFWPSTPVAVSSPKLTPDSLTAATALSFKRVAPNRALAHAPRRVPGRLDIVVTASDCLVSKTYAPAGPPRSSYRRHRSLEALPRDGWR
jgi:hypothetical protein